MQQPKAVPKAPSQILRKSFLFVLGTIMLVALPFIQPQGNRGFHEILEWIGQFLIIVGIIGRSWCTMYIGGQKFKDVIQSGPYSLSRNPLYMFSFIAAFGAGLQSGSLTFAVAALVIVFFVFDATIRNEEVVLAEKFGAPYDAYVARVPRYGPRFSTWKDEERLTVAMPLVYKTLMDGLVFFAIVPAAELIDWLQEAGKLPVLLRLPF